MNTLFNYRYCDASGYSSWGAVVFDGPFDGTLQARLVGAFESGEFFIAGQVRVPELFFEASSIDDHCFHTFARLEITDGEVTDCTAGRSRPSLLRPKRRQQPGAIVAPRVGESKVLDPFADRHPQVTGRRN